jgi:uncharacterized DUF497 family protein
VEVAGSFQAPIRAWNDLREQLHSYIQTPYNRSVPAWTFEWDESNIGHVARHQYLPDEVEEVFAEGCHVRRSREGRYLAYGRTFAGRMTLAVFQRLPGRRVRVITAREMSEKERRQYRRD